MTRSGTSILLEQLLRARPESDVYDAIAADRGPALLVSFVNPFSYGLLAAHPDIVRQLDVVYADGIALVRLLQFASGVPMVRRSFDMSSMAGPVFEICAQTQARLAVVGATDDEVDAFADRLLGQYPGLNLVYRRSGYFDGPEAIEQCSRAMSEAGVQVLLCGMGTVLQERFIIRARSRINGLRVAFTCGGFVHQGARKSLNYYPDWVNRLHLRWAYRLIHEPNTRSRVLRNYPPFMWRFARDWLRYRSAIAD